MICFDGLLSNGKALRVFYQRKVFDPMKILHILSSGRTGDSVSRRLSAQLVSGLKAKNPGSTVVERDVSRDLPFIDADLIAAFYTPEDKRTPEQKKRLSLSDALVDELFACDVLVISAPMYNFSIPAALKAWIDLIVRAGRTFRFKEGGGYESLLGDRKTYVVMASGGVPLGVPVDFYSPYLRAVLGFIGIESLEFIAAAGTNMANAQAVIKEAEDQIRKIAA